MRGPAGSAKRATLGVHGDVAPDEARKDAAPVIDRIKRGEEPFSPAGEPDGGHSVELFTLADTSAVLVSKV